MVNTIILSEGGIMIKYILTLFILLLSINGFGRSLIYELNPKSLKPEFQLEINENDSLVEFQVKWDKYPDNANRIRAYLELKDANRSLLFTDIAVNVGANNSFSFHVAHDLMNNSKFTIMIISSESKAADLYWFNLKKMYVGLKANEKDEGENNGE